MDVLPDRVLAEQFNERSLRARAGHRTNANAGDYQVINRRGIAVGVKENGNSQRYAKKAPRMACVVMSL